MKKLLLLLPLILIPIIYAQVSSSSINWASHRWVETTFCRLYNDCELNNLIVENLTVRGDYVNMSIINMNVSGNLDMNNHNITNVNRITTEEVVANGNIWGNGTYISDIFWEGRESNCANGEVYKTNFWGLWQCEADDTGSGGDINGTDINVLTINATDTTVNSLVIGSGSNQINLSMVGDTLVVKRVE